MKKHLLVALLIFFTIGKAFTQVMVKDINVESFPGITFITSDGFPRVALGSTLFFSANDGLHGTQIWKTDGTPAGTVAIKDLAPASSGYNVTELSAAGSLVYFRFNNKLYRTDGTNAGTIILQDSLHSPRPITAVGSNVYFFRSVYGNKNGDPQPGTTLAVGSTFFFAFNDTGSLINDCLWKSDGTSAGTVKITDFTTNSGQTKIGTLSYNGTDIFVEVKKSNSELWKTNGTLAGTSKLVDIGSNKFNVSKVFNGILYFTRDTFGTLNLWKSDGTVSGTTQVAGSGNFNQNVSEPAIGKFVTMNNNLYFNGGSKLHRITSAGIYSIIHTQNIGELLGEGGGYLYFKYMGTVLFQGANSLNQELGRSDGVSSYSLYRDMVGTIFTPYNCAVGICNMGSSPESGIKVGNNLYFVARTPKYNYELFKLNTICTATIQPPTISANSPLAQDTVSICPRDTVILSATGCAESVVWADGTTGTSI